MSYDPWWWLRGNHDCGCPRLIESGDQLAKVLADHPEWAADHRSEPPAEHPDVLVEAEIERSLLPVEEHLHGLTGESWAESRVGVEP